MSVLTSTFSSPKNKSPDSWVRLFDVSDARRHPKGHTIYKVKSTVFPINAPEAATQLIVWRRFSDFKRLFKNMSTMHANLHLSGNFPIFPKDRLFGRFEPQVIEERRQSALALLEFVASHAPLFTSQTFVRFFESGKDEESGKITDQIASEDVVLEPNKISTSSVDHEKSNIFSGVWLFRRSKDVDLSSGDTSEENDDIVSSWLDKNDDQSNSSLLSLFDPLCPPPTTQLSSSDKETSSMSSLLSSSSWLTSAIASNNCKEFREKDATNIFNFPKPFADFDEDSSVDKITLSNESDKKVIVEKMDLLNTKIAAESHCEFNVESPRCFSFFDDLLDDGTICNKDSSETSNCLEDYLLSSARLLTRAQESELRADFQTAFTHYKTAIGILLNGVKEDLDCNRRVAVRRKTAKYLCKAEEIYEKYLTSTEQETAFSNLIENKTLSTRSINSLKCPASELGRYKVLGILGKVLFVLDTLTDVTCVMKVVTKTSSMCLTEMTRLPVANSHMVKLLRYHETMDAVFLVMEYAAGGRLWNYVGAHINNYGGGFNDEPFESRACNVYAGKKYLCDSDNEVETTISDNCTLSMETVELVSKSRKLLKHVDRTISGITSSKQSPIHNCRQNSEEESQQIIRRRRTLSSSEISTRLGSGSLDLHQTATKVRHFSSVFRELDGSGDHSSESRLPDSCARIWASEIAAALMNLHSDGIVCRDLNPMNVLLDDRGHVLLTYFACLPGVDRALDVRAKEALYVAPEMLRIEQPTNPASADWFSLGGLLFAMLTGKTLSSCHPDGFWSHTTLHIPCSLSVEAESILKELLRPNPIERLGGGPEGDAAVRGHPFFADIDWNELRSRRRLSFDKTSSL